MLFGCLEVVADRAKAVAECLSTLQATEGQDGLAAPQRVAAVIS
jgi:hypothetical protein